MLKQLLVSSEVQAVLMNTFLLDEIKTGFWKDQRPSTHGAAWEGVEVLVSDTNTVGGVNFKSARFYDFLNPEFTKIHEAKLVQIAQTVKPNITFKSLKKELIELARIIGARMTDKTQEPARVYRGNNRTVFDVIRSVNREKVVTVAGAKAMVTKATSTVKKTVVKKSKEVLQEEGVSISTSSTGATVRRVSAKVS